MGFCDILSPFLREPITTCAWTRFAQLPPKLDGVCPIIVVQLIGQRGLSSVASRCMLYNATILQAYGTSRVCSSRVHAFLWRVHLYVCSVWRKHLLVICDHQYSLLTLPIFPEKYRLIHTWYMCSAKVVRTSKRHRARQLVRLPAAEYSTTEFG